MPKYKLVNDNDGNISFELKEMDVESAALEALEILGYSIHIEEED